MQETTGARYWETLGVAQRERGRQRLWRTHSDAVNRAWLVASLPPTVNGRLLKTDLFDEAQAQGLYPSLSANTLGVFAVDLSSSTIHAAGQRYPGLRGVQADVRRLPFRNAAFECVVSNSTLDHFESIDDIARGLAELYRVLQPGGYLLLTLDNLANPVVRLRNRLPFRLLNGLRIVPYSVGATCGPQQLRTIVDHAGFEVLDVGALLHCPRVLAVAAARLLERSGWLDADGRFSRLLMPFERLAGWRTRFMTGYFLTVVARRP